MKFAESNGEIKLFLFKEIDIEIGIAPMRLFAENWSKMTSSEVATQNNDNC